MIDINIDFAKLKTFKFGCDTLLDLRSFPNHRHLLSIRKSEQKCFLYCVASYFLENEIEDLTDGSDPIYSAWLSKLNTDGMKFPVKHADIRRFLTLNEWLNVSIHVLCFSQNHVYSAAVYGKGTNIIPLLAVPLEKGHKAERVTYYGIGHFVR